MTILLKAPTKKPNPRVTWNFRNANWTEFQDRVETKTSTINTEECAYKMLIKLYNRVQKKTYPEANHVNTSHFGRKS